MKYIGAKCRLCRREGEKLFLKGEKCVSVKCPLMKKNYPPGQHKKMFSKTSEYGRQLREKQKAKRIFNITERQFSNYYKKAARKKGTITGDVLLSFLELRLDNIVYRVGLASSRTQARQWISHGLIKVNGRKVTIASIQLKLDDVFEVSEKSKKYSIFTTKAKEKNQDLPSWIEFDFKTLKGSIKRDLEKDDLLQEINTQLIVEYYSR